MQRRTPLALVATAALALFAGACTDSPTGAPSARAPGQRASLSASASGPTLVSNTVKYRDTGRKPATGRSGNAMLEALALLDREGTTTFTYSARSAVDWWQNGVIIKAQTRALDPDGKQKFLDNFHPTFGINGRWVQYQGLARGDRLQLQANITGVDGNRTDVVTVSETIKRLPDLRVQLTTPGRVDARTG